MNKSLILAGLLLVLGGCGDETIPLEPIALDRLPPRSLEAAKRRLPNVTFDRARKSKFHGQDTIEIIGKDKQGKTFEVEVSTKGEVLEVE